ncbi:MULTISPECIES: DUF4190 domain-containing protein [unclassified Streptomyces]|uniref:DUF4190 domain-containing protein n=1 Tax=unclassified Streptomyces TaxID=2593676 RepID=UPI001BE7001C|nr:MULTISPECIES: DUF4190 domain-containing protein [unclassified Streptomyces]MBT2406026.1 DUF4190 domain-containing protein [Streptomyces sp. ISL-21]MBT2453569.1 DUF4190 domain-containing protein [Streptomyces sp. ISL-86]MBT2610628.1 DUF4190 domain-containing protein [Streptomyces sp. ISL-87]
MTDHSPEPRDPWAPPERPAVDLGKQQGTPGMSGAPSGAPAPAGPSDSSGPSVHDQQTIAGMPGAEIPPPAAQPQTPGPSPASYGYQAQHDQSGYGYPGGGPQAAAGYGYPAYPGYQGYPGSAAYQPYGAQPSNGFGVTALVLGILSVVGCIASFFSVALGIGAVVFGALGRGKANRGEATNGGMALAGLILGAVGIVLGGLVVLVMMFGLLADLGDIDSDPDYDSPYSNTQVHERI